MIKPTILLFCALLCVLTLPLQAQQEAGADIARAPVDNLQGRTSLSLSIYGVTLGMPWSEARTRLDRQNVPYIFEKGSSPTVYVPPQNSTYYYVLNPSSYEVIEMGVTGVSDLPLDNQFLYDGQRWRLTTARTQFFGNEGEYIMNEEGEAYNFPFQGVVLKYLSSGAFRFVLVSPTDKPLTVGGKYTKPDLLPVKTGSADAMQAQFDKARGEFEKKRYKPALALFRGVLNDAKDQLLRVRALYWMGESYYGLRQYGNAKATFLRVTKETDLATLVGPAKTMIARCNRRLGVK